MKKSKFTEEQITFALQQADTFTSPDDDLARGIIFLKAISIPFCFKIINAF